MSNLNKKNFTCCFTGHRIINIKEENFIKNKLKSEIKKMLDNKILYFGVGGAIGFDMLCAEEIINFKKMGKKIYLILVLPCENHFLKWNEKEKIRFYNILKNTDKVVYIDKNYKKNSTLKRNMHLVKNSSFCICYVKRKNSGSYFTLKKALEQGLKIIYI